MQYFLNSEGSVIIRNIINAIRLNKDYLSKIDGEIGDGDHGINMNKGFTMAGEQIEENHSFSDGAKILGNVLIMEIGGSMGPLYGTLFKRFFKETKENDKITADIILKMLESALNGVKEMGNAEVGDKTMIDTLSPAVTGLKDAISKKLSFEDSLNKCIDSAREGRDSTKDMIARIGRSSRLGERSKGVLDAGAVSCYIILESMNKSIISILKTDK
jgi:dihydroxyacetone kinase-like protein